MISTCIDYPITGIMCKQCNCSTSRTCRVILVTNSCGVSWTEKGPDCDYGKHSTSMDIHVCDTYSSTCIWSIYISVGSIFQSLLFLSWCTCGYMVAANNEATEGFLLAKYLLSLRKCYCRNHHMVNCIRIYVSHTCYVMYMFLFSVKSSSELVLYTGIWFYAESK
jgi:hypothetical protein